MFTHNLDPILFNFGIIVIRWYSLAYIAGILLGWWLGKKIIVKKYQNINYQFDLKEFDDLVTYLIISILVGGRIGYIIFYNLEYYVNNPIDIVKIWEGGMSFHGALIGIILSTHIFAIKRKISTFFLLDVLACVSPIGLFFGRIANFINGELVGKITNIPWSVIFPSYDSFPRHPSQLYEAGLEGIILFLIMCFVIFKKNYKPGSCSYMFLFFYGIFRIISELFREPDLQVGYIFNVLTMGTILSIFMIIAGIIIYLFLRKKNEV
jgi:phosphatidylglycerol---prolipoprotein diacylglyceryl transferase